MDEILSLLLGPLGTLVLALFILFSGFKRWWVFGWHYRETKEEKNEWKAIAMRSTSIGEKVAETAVALKENGPS